jgi:uncharacterized protein (TIGR02246 family)
MAGPLEDETRELLSALDALDSDRMLMFSTQDAQGVDEISRRWVRGRDQLAAYLSHLTGTISQIRTDLRDVEEWVLGDVGILTCGIDQRYWIEGTAHRVSAPTTLVYRREDDRWRLAVFHSIPLPEQTAR